LAEAQAKTGLDVAIVGTYYWQLPPMPELDRLRQLSARIDMFPSSRRLGADTKPFAAALQAHVQAANVVHIHGLWNIEQHMAARTAQQSRTPFIFRPCGMLAPWSLKQGVIKKRLYLELRLRRHLNRAAALHFTTRRERAAATKLGLTTPAIVEPNGVDFAEFSVAASHHGLRARFPELRDKPLVLFLGRIHPKKGLPLLVAALARLRHDSSMLVIAGPDEVGHTNEIKRVGHDLGVSERIKFVGPLAGADRAAAYRDADVFALTSYHENFGNTVLESLACGTPVVVSDQVDFCEEIAGSHLGSVVPLEPERIASELDTWLDDAKRRHAVRDSAPSFVQRRFSWTDIAARWHEHYRRLAGAPRTMTVSALPAAN
jgi:glycosyltransferase involved in cell wall biosynthesis